MTEQEFRQLAAEGFNRVPVVLETFADLDTPLSVYLKLANKPYSYLLESVQGGERFGRYSFIGLPAETRRYTPHVTLARLSGGTAGSVAEYLAAQPARPNLRFTAEVTAQQSSGLYLVELEARYEITGRLYDRQTELFLWRP